MKNIVLLLIAVLLLGGCSSKSKYQPEKVTSTLKYDTSLHASLRDVSREGATYNNGMVISQKRGLLKFKIDKNFRFIYDSGRAILIADNTGAVKIVAKGKTLFEHQFDFAISSAAFRGNIIAAVLSNNTLVLYDMKAKKQLYAEALEPTFANDARLANPLFLNDLIIFPTLDGRLLVMDGRKKVILRDVAISDKELFNNVIFLEERNDILVAATASKVIVINPRTIKTMRIDVKDIIYDKQAVYIFTKTGKVILTDLDLKVLKEKKFPFAMFSAVMRAKKIYAVEKSGYVIEMDKNLENVKVHALQNEISKPVFAFRDRLFLGSEFIKLK